MIHADNERPQAFYNPQYSPDGRWLSAAVALPGDQHGVFQVARNEHFHRILRGGVGADTRWVLHGPVGEVLYSISSHGDINRRAGPDAELGETVPLPFEMTGEVSQVSVDGSATVAMILGGERILTLLWHGSTSRTSRTEGAYLQTWFSPDEQRWPSIGVGTHAGREEIHYLRSEVTYVPRHDGPGVKEELQWMEREAPDLQAKGTVLAVAGPYLLLGRDDSATRSVRLWSLDLGMEGEVLQADVSGQVCAMAPFGEQLLLRRGNDLAVHRLRSAAEVGKERKREAVLQFSMALGRKRWVETVARLQTLDETLLAENPDLQKQLEQARETLLAKATAAKSAGRWEAAGTAAQFAADLGHTTAHELVAEASHRVGMTREIGSKPSKAIAFSPDGKQVAVGTSSDFTVLLFDLTEAGGPPRALQPAERASDEDELEDDFEDDDEDAYEFEDDWLSSSPSKIGALAFDPAGRRLLAGGEEAEVFLWNLAEDSSHRSGTLLQGYAVRGVSFLDDQMVAVSDAEILLYTDLGSIPHRKEVQEYESEFLEPPWLEGGRVLESDREAQKLYVWDVGSGELIAEHPEPEGAIVSSLSSAGTFLIQEKKELAVWKLEGFEKLRVLGTPADELGYSSSTTTAFSTTGDFVAVSYDHGIVRVWETATGKLSETLAHPETRPLSMAFSPDGTRLAVVTSEYLRVWQLD